MAREITEKELRNIRHKLFELASKKYLDYVDISDNHKIKLSETYFAKDVLKVVGLGDGNPLITQFIAEYKTWIQTNSSNISELRDHEKKNNSKD